MTAIQDTLAMAVKCRNEGNFGIARAIVHLAGSLGAPTWLILPTVPHWPWMLDRVDSPWYAAMRLFRQKRAGEWDEVFDRLASKQ